MPIELFCASGNPAKLREFQLAAGVAARIHALSPVACPEEGETFEENAAAKALCYSRTALAQQDLPTGSLLVFSDDSGLAVDALDGAPGVRSSRFAGPDAGDQANNALLLEKMAGIPAAKRRARFVCCIALAREGRLLRTFHGEVEGLVLPYPAGSGGFGYDPLFLVPNLGKTFAQLSPQEKLRYSHRGRAFRELLQWLRIEQAG